MQEPGYPHAGTSPAQDSLHSVYLRTKHSSNSELLLMESVTIVWECLLVEVQLEGGADGMIS